jgi:hypothetical protein
LMYAFCLVKNILKFPQRKRRKLYVYFPLSARSII